MWKRPSIEDRAEGVVTFAVLADAVLAALRRLAQEAEVVRHRPLGLRDRPSVPQRCRMTVLGHLISTHPAAAD